MADKIENWTCDQLGKLGIDATVDIARYILSIETAEELEEYMLEFLDGSDPRTKKFIKELIVKWRPYNNSKADANMQVYRKFDQGDNYIAGKEKKKNLSAPKEKKSSQKNYVLNGYEVQHRGILPGEEPPEQPLPVALKPQHTEKDVKKKQQKFVPLFSKEGQALSIVQLAGRHVCECQAAKHRLINNCTRCGRVVCDQEGSGPCLFCGNLVCSLEEGEILSRGTKKSEKLRQQLMKDSPSALLGGSMFNGDRDYLPHDRMKVKESYTKAEKHKDKLLEYDRTSVRRTQVIDDEADYFSTDSNQWLNKEDRELLRKREEELRSQRHASRKDRKITLDFAGRQVIEEDPSKTVNMYDVNDEVVQKVNFGARPKEKSRINEKGGNAEVNVYLVNPKIQVDAPKYIPQSLPTKHSDVTAKSKENTARVSSRIQDRELQEMSDEGMCMSMHQPWASLLVAGIKIHEGRTWYTAHRGRLWIAATAKSPDPAEIADVEHMYKTIYKNRDIQFPGQYPVGCLLGCVDVVDCLSQDTYLEQFPDGESGSPFVFICENPRELLVKFPVKGKHKIYKLDSHIHKAAKKGLR